MPPFRYSWTLKVQEQSAVKEKSIADSCSLGFLHTGKQGGVQVKLKGGKKFKGKPKGPTFYSGTSTASPIDGNDSPPCVPVWSIILLAPMAMS